jgi:hypothetical protein
METLIDKTFDNKSLNKYDLNLNIGSNLIIANVSKTKSNTHIAISEKVFDDKLNQIEFPLANLIKTLKESPIKISKQYAKVSISVSNRLFSVVPKVLFQKNNINLYVKQNARITSSHDYRYKILEKEGLVICYAIPENLNTWIKKVFPTAKITHEIAVVTESVLRDFYSLSDDRVVINIHKNYFYIASLKDAKLEFINTFVFSTKEDLLYYILFTFEQLSINPSLVEVFLTGEIQKGSEEHQLLFQYIKNLHFGFRNKNIKISGGLNEIPNHYCYTIFNQSLCV